MPSGLVGAFCVVMRAVAHVEDFVGGQAQAILNQLKEERVGFFKADFARDDDQFEKTHKIQSFQDAPQPLVPVGENGESKTAFF